MIIDNPFGTDKIDVTGWDLDFLYEQIRSVNDHLSLNPDTPRALSFDEAEALGFDGTLRDGSDEVWTDHPQINERLATWGTIIDEAIFQRDLPRARAAKAEGRALNINEQAAWDRYLADIGSDR